MPLCLLDMDANGVLALAVRGLDKTKMALKLARAPRQLQRWCDRIGDTFSGQPNGLHRADELIDAVQVQSQSAALLLLAWLQIRLIERRLPSGAGSAEILIEIERVSADLKAQSLSVLCERERANRK
jgi:hypothetical protein